MDKRSERVRAARGELPLDTLIENAQIVNVLTGEIYAGAIGIAGGYIAHLGPYNGAGPEPRSRMDAEGKFAVPGLVDTHVHIESSMMSPAGFAAAVLAHGTTTVVIDPHEIGNVLGMRGVRYMLEATAHLPLRVYVQVPSCVPAVPDLETAGAEFGPQEVAEMLTWERVIGLAEVMDYVGVIAQTPRMRGILAAALERGTVISGHAPGVRGRQLAAYLMAGPDSDHEGCEQDELLEKLRLGMAVESRTSSFGDDMAAVGSIVRRLGGTPPNLVMCTDDIFPEDLMQHGHMDWGVRRAIQGGLTPVEALRVASVHGAMRHRLYDLGAIAPGKRADIVLSRSLEEFAADEVWVDGALVARGGRCVVAPPVEPPALESENTVHLPHPPTPADYALPARPGRTWERVRVIKVQPASPILGLEIMALPVREGSLDVGSSDVCLAAVQERHGRTGRRGYALVRGMGLQRGAAASTVAHDSHNLLVIGRNADDMALAANQLAACGGGLCCAEGGRVLALLPLPIAGLMSPLPLAELVPLVQKLSDALRSLGICRAQPISAIVGMALPVIPHYSVTDHGLVDVDNQRIISLWADEE
jgi:adenine deaminase